MGNADSQSTVVAAAPPSCSFRFSSKGDEVPSARSWWRSNQACGRSHGGRSLKQTPHRNSRGSGRSTLGHVDSGAEGSGVCGERTCQQGGGSPKVLLSKDGSTRVEFTNSRVVAMEPEGFTSITTTAATAAVPDPSLRTSKGSLLSSDGSWYDSPWGGSAELVDNVIVCGRSADPSSGYATYASHHSENTAASDGTYTTIFSARVENISPGFNSTPLFPTADTDTAGYTTCSSGRTEDSGIGDSLILPPDLMDLNLISLPAALMDISVYSSHNALPAFPTVPDTPHTSFPSTACLDDVIQEEQDAGGASGQRYSSLTLPCRRSEPICSTTTRNNRKDFLKSRIQQLSDWTGSLSRKKRRIQEPYGGESTDVFTNRLTGGLVSSGAVWSSDQLHTMNYVPVVNPSSDDQRQNIYENFMQELETSCGGPANHTEPSEGEEEDEEEIDGEVKLGGGEQLDLLLEKEQGVVRRAGWLSFKALITISKDGKLELVARHKWRTYWVTLKGCTLLFHETYGRGDGGEHKRSPHYALLAEDSIVQAVPEHPKKEHVFCLSNSYGDVYLFQATNQTDLENWVTAVHSASATLLARQQGKEDTLRLLRVQSRSLLHKIDMDGKMKKMAELQLSVIKEHKNRKAVESQIQQWDQNLEKLNLDLFRLRCYLSSLQGGELPNPKSLLAVVSRASKSTLGRLGVFSVSSFHALVCSRDEEVLRRRRRSLSGGNSKRRSLLSSLKTLDKHNLNTTSTSSQVRDEPSVSVLDVFSLLLSRPDAQDFGLAVTGHVDGVGKSRVYVSEVDPRGLAALEGLRVGDQVLAVNGASVSALDLHLLQNLFTHQRLHLLLRRDTSHDPKDKPAPTTAAAALPEPADTTTWATGDSSLSDFAPPPVFDDITLCASDESTEQNMDRVYSLLQSFPEGRAADADVPKNPYDREAVFQPASPAHLSVCQRLRKVIEELVDTEKSYVKDLVCLLELYLTPLQNETFLSKEEMEALFGSLPEMLDFQRVFLQTLEEKIMSCPNFSRLEKPEHFKKLLFSLGGSFLYYADHFKLYSGFCANHIKVQKVLERAKTDDDFKRFLEMRNPTNQHSTCLESFLIKPVQRVLKYPLLLRELMVLTQRESPEHTHLTEALRAMEKVATHINEMQKIYEDFGCVFEQLAAEQSGRDKQVSDISMGEFLVRSSAVWLNPLPSLGRMRKEPELTLFVFKRAVILVYRENSKLKRRMKNAVRSADPDPLKFCWLIPPSAVQVRPAKTTGSESACVWELVHSRSEVKGHPETVFQLRSSGLESKASVLRSLRSVLRERACDGSLRSTRLSTAERRRQQRSRVHAHRATRPLEDRCMVGETRSEPLLPSHATCNVAGKRSRLCSLTSDLEAQLQKLNFTEEEVEPGAPNHSDGHKVAEKRRSSSLQRGDAKDASSERHFRVTSVHASTE
ncbi:T-lymphoma invasion and metastasis-inducing protein 2-like isoform X1 [Solea senegalensis]|uniref:T-lymphoma invasion and metastasis-inducing protein 2-like isoform X1 n=1 Tax=Solea senegalensis TaxID=28829 RepID=A0AAV6PHR8_SOLSE|nr:T-lymphoma invasion and metastasis-inducing protein 2-like isoform X1 [Solea senegalensis]